MSESVGASVNGSRIALVASGTSSMSDSLIPCQPRIEEPSKPRPSSKADSSNDVNGSVMCCQRPNRSQNFRSTIWARVSVAHSSASRASGCVPFARKCFVSISAMPSLLLPWTTKKGPRTGKS